MAVPLDWPFMASGLGGELGDTDATLDTLLRIQCPPLIQSFCSLCLPLTGRYGSVGGHNGTDVYSVETIG